MRIDDRTILIVLGALAVLAAAYVIMSRDNFAEYQVDDEFDGDFDDDEFDGDFDDDEFDDDDFEEDSDEEESDEEESDEEDSDEEWDDEDAEVSSVAYDEDN
jgi:hypothetical protein